MKKGSLEETLNYARHADDRTAYTVSYRDKDQIRWVTLQDFTEREDLIDVPVTRILEIKRAGKTVWIKGQKEVLVK